MTSVGEGCVGFRRMIKSCVGNELVKVMRNGSW